MTDQHQGIGSDDRARVDAEVARVWKEFHAPHHPTLSLPDALRDQLLGRVVRGHALLNIRHGMDRPTPPAEVSHAA